MHISKTSDHALRVALYLAQQEPEELVPAKRVAAALGAPANYLAKTMGALARAGLLKGMRGPTGGYRLARPAAEIAVADVIEAVEPPLERGACLLGDRPCTDREPCAAHALWTAMMERAWQALRVTSVADLLAGDLEVLPGHPRG